MAITNEMEWLEKINWNADGLIPAIAQEYTTGRVLTLAWMNREALQLTCAEGPRSVLVQVPQQAMAQGRTVRSHPGSQGDSSGLR